MAVTRILGTIGDTIKITGTLDSQPKRMGRLIDGRFRTVYNHLLRNIVTSEGKKFSHLWFDYKEPIKEIGKVIIIKGQVSMYVSTNTSGTRLSNVGLVAVEPKKRVDKKKK